MAMTLASYIKNPSGGRTRAHMVGQSEAAKAVYTDKYNKIMLKTAGAIEYKLFRAPDDSRFIMILKIPSESIPDLTYDVGIEFYTKDDVSMKATHLDDYFVRFFSNDPNFTYTYAYTFKKNKMIIPELESKLDPKSLKEKPKVTNPNTEIGYCKSIYFAQLFFEMKGLTNKVLWHGAPPIRSSTIQGSVMATGNKLIQVERLRKLHAASKRSSIHIGDTDNIKQLGVKVNQVKSLKASQDAIQRVYSGKTKRTQMVKKVKTIG